MRNEEKRCQHEIVEEKALRIDYLVEKNERKKTAKMREEE